MAEQADVYVTNWLDTHGDINVSRKLADGTTDINITVAYGEKSEKIYLGGTDVSVIITPPSGVETKDHPLRVKSDIDLAVSHSITGSNWTIQIATNDGPPEVPTTVNVNVGDDEPEPPPPE